MRYISLSFRVIINHIYIYIYIYKLSYDLIIRIFVCVLSVYIVNENIIVIHHDDRGYLSKVKLLLIEVQALLTFRIDTNNTFTYYNYF